MTSLFKRMSDVLNANINDLIDRVEDPERMVKQIIREMEDNINKAKEGVVEAITSEKQLQKQLENNQQQMADWLQKAELALSNNNEELARAALARKKEFEAIVKTLEPSWQAAKSTSERLKQQLRALEAKLEEAKHKRTALAARQHAAQARQQMDKTLTALESGLNAHSNFERMEDRIAEMEARTAALEELRDDRSQLEKEFLDMKTHSEIDDELQSLKKKINNPSKTDIETNVTASKTDILL